MPFSLRQHKRPHQPQQIAGAGAQKLTDTGAKVAAVARKVGDESEAAFSRAFKKYSGASPAGSRAAGGTNGIGALR
jgi:transcriptional regulator GlxA family with amidase domain